jgi:hypothetical protein
MDTNIFNNAPNSFEAQNFGNQPYMSSQFNTQVTSNIIRVVSLDDAIMRTPNRPCDIVYFNQDKDEFYRVKVDLYGKKTWAAFLFNAPAQLDNTPVTRAEYEQLVAKVETLMRGGGSNVESDGQNVQ